MILIQHFQSTQFEIYGILIIRNWDPTPFCNIKNVHNNSWKSVSFFHQKLTWRKKVFFFDWNKIFLRQQCLQMVNALLPDKCHFDQSQKVILVFGKMFRFQELKSEESFLSYVLIALKFLKYFIIKSKNNSTL